MFFINNNESCYQKVKPVLILLVLILIPIADANDILRGKEIATTQCISCHGTDGNSPDSMYPKLAGQHFGYLQKQLLDYKPNNRGEIIRKNQIMQGFAANLTDEDINAVSKYYASQTLKPETAKNKNLKPIAEKLFRGGDFKRDIPSCTGCHGPAGAGIPTIYPAIAGQYSQYTKSALLAYRNGERDLENSSMRTIAKYLTDLEIEALADYLAGMRTDF